ncbi:MAG TPA: TonB-dependent receptor [Vicinamibacterales bacterium]|nr:TonB-dependent receptor [Vicinamibacterales bacterium]
MNGIRADIDIANGDRASAGDGRASERIARAFRYACAALLVFARGGHADDQDTAAGTQLETVEVTAVAPTAGVEVPVLQLPYSVQTTTSADLERALTSNVMDYMNRHLSGISMNAVANNPLQPDLQYRGFTATALLGGSEGISVYLDGVRINEVFGDTVNWDLIPEEIIASMSLVSGANPVFGLNTLGGAVTVKTRDGFSDPGQHLQVDTGSFGRTEETLASGGNNGAWGYYVMGNHMEEDGWRKQSNSNATNYFGALSWRGDAGMFDLHVAHADTKLTGNEATPIQELAQFGRDSIYTAPDQTLNRLNMISGQGTWQIDDATALSATLYDRRVDTRSYNGDTTDFSPCEDDDAILCGDDGEPVLDQNGGTIPVFYDAINNISDRRQHGRGGTLQLAFKQPLFGFGNTFVIGAEADRGSVDYGSVVEASFILPNLHTASDQGIFVPDDALSVHTTTRSAGLYATDVFSLTDKLTLTASGRYNHTRTTIADTGGNNPDLDGKHTFHRFNPAVGATYQWSPAVNFYAGYGESTRAPTPVELTCADENAPCKLPNQFVSDPPLKQVVAKSWELGMRGSFAPAGWIGRTHWRAGVFRTTNHDDILFQATGGSQSNEGFFANVGRTRRQGFEAAVDGKLLDGRIDWFANYTHLDATYRTGFFEDSIHHPDADEGGQIFVPRGAKIPGLPRNAVKIGADFALTPSITIGGDVLYNSDQYLRGDEANLLEPIGGYALFNLRAVWHVRAHVKVFARIENVFDRQYDTFGILGDPTPVFPG